jgi:hypothetical protein
MNYLNNIEKKQLIYDTIEYILADLFNLLLRDNNILKKNIINEKDKNYYIITEINDKIYNSFCNLIFNKKNYDYILF